jgi:hypothetical protein
MYNLYIVLARYLFGIKPYVITLGVKDNPYIGGGLC